MSSFRSRLTRPTISVVCATAHPGPLVAEALGRLREVVDEIVVAADSRVEAADLGHYAAVADVLLRYEFGRPDHHWPWLVNQAHGDWLLELDGDEIPSAALIAALRELVADRRVRQYVLPIHWPWPDPSRRLIDEPWGSDSRLRLLRNDGRLTYAARMHAHAEPDPPILYLDELPVYHLDLLFPDRARREAKVARYDGELFGLLTPEGLPFNEAFYLPEAGCDERATVAIPTEDAEAIARSLGADYDPTRSLDPATVPLYDKAAVSWYAPRTDLPVDAYRGTLTFARPLPPFTAERRDHTVWVYVTNEGTARWPGGENKEPLICIGVSWQPVGGGSRQDVGRAFLPRALDPGERELVPVGVCGPPQSGPAELVLDLAHEGVHWFERELTAQVDVGASAAERLRILENTYGSLLPPAAVIQERREIGGRDCLLRDSALGAKPVDRRTRALSGIVDFGEQDTDVDMIARLVALVRSERPATVIEFGCGATTIVLAKLMAKQRRSGPRVITFDHDPSSIHRISSVLTEHDLQRIVYFVHLPLGGGGDGRPSCYQLSAGAAGLLNRYPPEMIIVGGPPLDSEASRLGTADLVFPFLKSDTTLLLTDALSDAGLLVGKAWELRDDITVHGIRPTSKGLLEATLRVSSTS
jgi:hypothetical protein